MNEDFQNERFPHNFRKNWNGDFQKQRFPQSFSTVPPLHVRKPIWTWAIRARNHQSMQKKVNNFTRVPRLWHARCPQKVAAEPQKTTLYPRDARDVHKGSQAPWKHDFSPTFRPQDGQCPRRVVRAPVQMQLYIHSHAQHAWCPHRMAFLSWAVPPTFRL